MPVKSQEFRKDRDHMVSAMQKQEKHSEKNPIYGSDFYLFNKQGKRLCYMRITQFFFISPREPTEPSSYRKTGWRSATCG